MPNHFKIINDKTFGSQIDSKGSLRTFGSNRSTRQSLIKLLSNFKISLKKLKNQGVKGLKFLKRGYVVIHTSNIFEEYKMCHILTSNSAHYLIISGYIFLGKITLCM